MTEEHHNNIANHRAEAIRKRNMLSMDPEERRIVGAKERRVMIERNRQEAIEKIRRAWTKRKRAQDAAAEEEHRKDFKEKQRTSNAMWAKMRIRDRADKRILVFPELDVVPAEDETGVDPG